MNRIDKLMAIYVALTLIGMFVALFCLIYIAMFLNHLSRFIL